MSNPSPAPQPRSGTQRIMEISFSLAPYRILVTALELGVFSAIANGKHSAADIAAAVGASQRGSSMLLDALVAFEFLEKQDGGYELTADSARYLVRESADYAGALLESGTQWEAWGHLAESVRSGKPWRSRSDTENAQQFFPMLIRTLHVTNRDLSHRLAAALVPHGARHGLRVLDIGCGSAVWSIAIAKIDPEARVTALDLPMVLESTRQFAARENLLDRYEFLPRDMHAADFPPSRYDVALLGSIVHMESPKQARDLFRRIHDALAGGGRLVIIDLIPMNDRTGPPLQMVFALNMLLNTDEGDTYTLAEYQSWLRDAGFARVETLEIGSHSPAIVATKVLP
ncbi:MAG TPA: class I SAM-dependent methyltransferase [Candidatus Acidoferrales bacterium]|nr:class I SAM-dependent methyltransferase [Candidatus Acidoferrales bacterium]